MGSVREVHGDVLPSCSVLAGPLLEHCAQFGAQHFRRYRSESIEKSIWEDDHLVHVVRRKG